MEDTGPVVRRAFYGGGHESPYSTGAARIAQDTGPMHPSVVEILLVPGFLVIRSQRGVVL